jgi:hypothetical protein
MATKRKTKTTARRRSSKGTAKPYAPTAKITIKSKENPHRTKTSDHAKFRKLMGCPTVEAALAAGIDRGYLRYMVGRALIAIG